MQDNISSNNRFLTDHRLKKFILSSNGQDYELCISPTFSDQYMSFYTIFKPLDYDHIIYLSGFSKQWGTAKKIFKEVASQVSENYNINIEDYPELQSFIEKI